MVNGLAPVYGWFREGFDTFDPRLGVIRVEFRWHLGVLQVERRLARLYPATSAARIAVVGLEGSYASLGLRPRAATGRISAAGKA